MFVIAFKDVTFDFFSLLFGPVSSAASQYKEARIAEEYQDKVKTLENKV